MEGKPPEGLKLPSPTRLRIDAPGDSVPVHGPDPDARIDRAERLEARARLERALAAWSCPSCGAAAAEVYRTDGRVRYVKCARCGETGKVIA